MSLTRNESGKRFSQAVSAGGLVFLAGQVATDTSADVRGQTRQALAAVDRLLAAAGSRRDQLVSVTIYLRDIADYAVMNEVWDTWLGADAKPARATVEARLALSEYRVEVQAIAACAP
jgi:enamine deaminase RidA (YjgF/YER057c/UK114 family)